MSNQAKRPPHRPRVVERGSTVCAWVSGDEHDCLVRLANSRRQSVSAFLRGMIRRETVSRGTDFSTKK